MGKVYRKGRLGEEIRRIVSGMLLKDIKDPRLSGGIVTVSGVEVTQDGSYATIFITKLGRSATEEISREEKNDVLTAFNSAKGIIRREIGKQIKLRHVPELSFKIDTSMEYGRRISKLINELDNEKTEVKDEKQHFERDSE